MEDSRELIYKRPPDNPAQQEKADWIRRRRGTVLTVHYTRTSSGKFHSLKRKNDYSRLKIHGDNDVIHIHSKVYTYR